MGKAKQSTIMKWMDETDMYGSKVYSYNFEGRQNINSIMGVIASLVVYAFAISFFVG